ncbi:hypothetical protein M5K25_011048 [Dendrobium thyrsiflorum]
MKGWSCEGQLINNNLEASRVCLSSSLFVVAVRLRCLAGGVEIARLASSAPVRLGVRLRSFDDFRFLSDRKLRHFDRKSSLAVKVSFWYLIKRRMAAHKIAHATLKGPSVVKEICIGITLGLLAGGLWKMHHWNEQRKTRAFYDMLDKGEISVVVPEE